MDEAWTPPLQLHECAGRCRLSLVGVCYGHGATLQEAADDLLQRVEALLRALRGGGFHIPPELGPPDLRLFAFLYELGELVARGGDLRERLFGPSRRTDLAA